MKGPGTKSFIHVTDIMPTVLELTGTSYPDQYGGKQIHAMMGRSVLSVLEGKSETRSDTSGRGYELFEMKAYIRGHWKILRQPLPFGTGTWQLFDLENDPGEASDLSAKNPELFKEMIKAWEDYAVLNDVYDHKGHYDSVYKSSYGMPKEKE